MVADDRLEAEVDGYHISATPLELVATNGEQTRQGSILSVEEDQDTLRVGILWTDEDGNETEYLVTMVSHGAGSMAANVTITNVDENTIVYDGTFTAGLDATREMMRTGQLIEPAVPALGGMELAPAAAAGVAGVALGIIIIVVAGGISGLTGAYDCTTWWQRFWHKCDE